MHKLKLAFRNIARKKLQSILIFLCSLIAAYTIFIQMAQRNSVESNLRKLISEAISGQFVIYDSDRNINVLESQFADLTLFSWQEKQSQDLIQLNPAIKSISPRLRFGGLIAYGNETTGLNFQALTPAHIHRLESILELTEGRLPEQPDEIILNELIAENLKCKTGDTLVILANNTDGYLSDALVKVSGTFSKSGVGQFLIPIGFIHHTKGMEILGIDSHQKMELVLNFNDFDYSKGDASRLTKQVNAVNPKLKLATWNESAPLLNSILSVWISFGFIIQSIFILFSFLILVNIILMMTNHRKKEIGTLLAIGFKHNWITNSIALEYLIITVSGVLSGGLILKTAFLLISQEGIYIPWEAMQVAYLSTHLKPYLYVTDILLISAFFGTTTYLAVVVSLRKLRKTHVTSLLTSHT